METDLTSVIIGLASLATFFIPIGVYQHNEKKGKKEAEKYFLQIADELGFQAGDFEILRNRAVIGLGKNQEQLLYVTGKHYQLIEMPEVVECKVYKKYKTRPYIESGRIQQIGIHLQLQKCESVRLAVFEGKEGTVIGDERLIAQRWIQKIHHAKKAFISVSSI